PQVLVSYADHSSSTNARGANVSVGSVLEYNGRRAGWANRTRIMQCDESSTTSHECARTSRYECGSTVHSNDRCIARGIGNHRTALTHIHAGCDVSHGIDLPSTLGQRGNGEFGLPAGCTFHEQPFENSCVGSAGPCMRAANRYSGTIGGAGYLHPDAVTACLHAIQHAHRISHHDQTVPRRRRGQLVHTRRVGHLRECEGERSYVRRIPCEVCAGALDGREPVALVTWKY